jgi:hypothetical protein
LTKKLTYEFVREMFAKDNYILLSKEYVECGKKLNVLCPKGHETTLSVDAFKDGNRCKICANDKKRLDPEFVKSFIENEGYTLLSDFINSKTKIKLLCPEGHEHNTTWNVFYISGSRCRKCSIEKSRLKYDFVKNKFEEEGFLLVSEKYEYANKKLDVICKNGHEFKITYANFRNGIRCKKCSFEKLSERIIKQKILIKGSLLDLYPDIAKEWHPFKNIDKNPEDFLSRSCEKVWWKCNTCGHEWYVSICSRTEYNCRCPICAKRNSDSKIATHLKNYCIEKFGKDDVELEYKIFKNLKTGRFLPFDIYIISKNIYCEVMGVQHYIWSKHFDKTIEIFENSCWKDNIKKEFAIKNGKYIEIDLRYVKNINDSVEYFEKSIQNIFEERRL